MDWISFSNATSGLEDGTLDFVVDANEGDEIREGIITCSPRINQNGRNRTADRSYGWCEFTGHSGRRLQLRKITTNKFGLFGRMGRLEYGRYCKFGATIPLSGFSVLLHLAPGRHIYSYVCAINEQATSLNWLWRKLSGLIPGKSYTFSFWYKTPPEKDMVQTGNIRLGAVVDAADISNLSNPLAPEVTFGYVAASDGVLSSSDEHKKVSYTFTMPVGKTEVYIVWRRNGHQQPFLDDMSLVLNP